MCLKPKHLGLKACEACGEKIKAVVVEACEMEISWVSAIGAKQQASCDKGKPGAIERVGEPVHRHQPPFLCSNEM